jgi:hypothetical protein
MIVHIAFDIETDGTIQDLPGLVAKALTARLSGSLRVVDPVQRKAIDLKVWDLCAVYGNHDGKAAALDE